MHTHLTTERLTNKNLIQETLALNTLPIIETHYWNWRTTKIWHGYVHPHQPTCLQIDITPIRDTQYINIQPQSFTQLMIFIHSIGEFIINFNWGYHHPYQLMAIIHIHWGNHHVLPIRGLHQTLMVAIGCSLVCRPVILPWNNDWWMEWHMKSGNEKVSRGTS